MSNPNSTRRWNAMHDADPVRYRALVFWSTVALLAMVGLVACVLVAVWSADVRWAASAVVMLLIAGVALRGFVGARGDW